MTEKTELTKDELYKINKEKIKQRNREYAREYYRKNKAKRKQYIKNWRKQNEDKVKIYDLKSNINKTIEMLKDCVNLTESEEQRLIELLIKASTDIETNVSTM